MNTNSNIVFKIATILASAKMIVKHILTIHSTALQKWVLILLYKIKAINCCILEFKNTVTTTALFNGDKVFLWLFKYWYFKPINWVSHAYLNIWWFDFHSLALKKSVIWHFYFFPFFNEKDLLYLRLLILVYFRLMFIPFLFFAGQILILFGDCEFLHLNIKMFDMKKWK